MKRRRHGQAFLRNPNVRGFVKILEMLIDQSFLRRISSSSLCGKVSFLLILVIYIMLSSRVSVS